MDGVTGECFSGASVLNPNENNLNNNFTIPVFKYDTTSFKTGRTTPLSDSLAGQKSEFDRELIDRWQNAMKNNSFRYNLDSVQRKELEGCTKLMAQLNHKRFSNRRKPQAIHSLCEPFSNELFNFTKVKDNEVLFRLERAGITEPQCHHLVVINVSPIEFGHVLIIPDAINCHPQIVTEQSMRLALEVSFLSQNRGLRLGFNSLCAFASVNHLHFHGMYINHNLPIDNVKVCGVGEGLLQLVDYPVNGFAFNVPFEEIEVMSRAITAAVDRMVEKDIPHNIFMSRGSSLEEKGNHDCDENDVVRVFLFPKVMSTDAQQMAFNSAFLELGGYLPIGDEQEYNKMDEVEAIRILNKYAFRQDECNDLALDLLQILQADTLDYLHLK